VVGKRLLECAFLIPIRRDRNLSDGRLHRERAWNWLEEQLLVFGGATLATEVYEGWYVDPDTRKPVQDLSKKYFVAIPRAEVARLRSLLKDACAVFRQKCIYLSVAGQVEFVKGPQAMKPANVYADLNGNEIALDGLDAEERRLVARLRRRARTHPDWCDFGTHYLRTVAEFYEARGVSRKALVRTAVFRIAQDLSSRLGLASGLVRPSDYRDELEDLIREQFPTRRAFCEATGISEDMLSHVLAGRKDLSLGALNQALERIGYRLRMVPMPERKPAAARKRTG
jgi:hypothetical protein